MEIGEDDIDWNDLRYFAGALRSKSLVGTARSMNVATTAVARRLSALERGIGVVLFLRGPDGLDLTATGEALAPLVREVEQAVGALRARGALERMRVRVGVPAERVAFYAATLRPLRRQHVSVELVSGAQADAVRAGVADLAIHVGPVPHEQCLVVRKLSPTDPLVLVYRREVRSLDSVRTVARFIEHALRDRSETVRRPRR